ncbi:hypothetical protein, partial [Nocardia jejuensis]|uniref:hypothetical protein n=1 Tax=Nocardia jejuensis TaxID=328049 RepID=UPI00159C6D9A
MNSVWATTAGDRNRPAVRVRRTAVTFDSAGGARIGGIPRFAPVVTDFADLTTEPDPVVISGRIWSPADLVAAVVNGLIEINAPEAPAVTTYPACYSEKHITRLRRALDWSGAADVTLMPEPVAAVEWLDAEQGVAERGITLVYDLGGNCLDIAVVRTEAEDERGILGKPERSHEYGGRPLGSLLARYARSIEPDAAQPVSAVVPASDTSRLRTWHIRNSLRLVRSCVHGAGIAMGDIDRVLLIGGAARPIEVARVLADLGRPVVMSTDPAHTVAVGAALAAFRGADTGSAIAKYAPRAAVFSGAAVASALAMSAATVLGGPVASPPGLQAAPGPADSIAPQFGAGDVMLLDDTAAPINSPRVHAVTVAAAVHSYVPGAAAAATVTRNWSGGRPVDTTGGGSHCETRVVRDAITYSNPAQFTNPLPFDTTTLASSLSVGVYSGQVPSVSLPGSPKPNVGSPISGTGPGSTAPGSTSGGTQPGGTQPGGTQPGAGTPGSTPGGTTGETAGSTTGGGATPGGTAGGTAGGSTTGGTTSDGGSTAGGTGGGTTTPGGTSGETAAGSTTGGTTSDGGSTAGGSTGGSTSGGSAGGGTASGGGASGGAAGGGDAGGGGTGGSAGGAGGGDSSGGGASGGGASGGGASGGGASGGGASGGGASGGGASGGGASGGGASGGGASGGGASGGGTSGGGASGGGASGGGASAGGASGGGASGGGASAGGGAS